MDTNDDLIIEILLNLSVKSLLRFRSVCKSWCNIVDSSAFRKSHQSRKNINDDDDILFLQFSREGHKWELSSTLFMDNWKLGNAFPPPFHEFLNLNFWEDLVVDGPINGLIFMYDKYLYNNERCTYIAICNPCLGETRILPVSLACSSVFDYRRRLRYATRIIGFGFDSVTKDYKVVHIIWSGDGNSYVEVYSGRTNTWKVLATNIIEDNKPLTTNSQIKTTCKGSGAVAYWRIDHPYDIILSFDMQNEAFETIRLPEVVKATKLKDVYAKDDDLLVLFVYTADRTEMEVWELEINAKERGWIHVRNVNLRQFLGARTVALWKYGVVLTSYFRDESRTKDKEFIFYDYSTHKERKRVEFSTYIRDGELLVEYKCTFNSLEMCLNSAGMES